MDQAGAETYSAEEGLLCRSGVHSLDSWVGLQWVLGVIDSEVGEGFAVLSKDLEQHGSCLEEEERDAGQEYGDAARGTIAFALDVGSVVEEALVGGLLRLGHTD